MKKVILSLVLIVLIAGVSYAKDLKESQKCICNSQEREKSFTCLKELKEFYFQDNRYSEFVDLLSRLCPEDKGIAPYLSYNIALSRYQQLKHLEENNSWDEYFANGNEYRNDIVKESAKAGESLPKESPEFLYSKLLLYRFHKDQQDAFAEESLLNLMSSASEYVRKNKDLNPLKEIADALASYGETSKAKELYRFYAKSLINTDLKDEALKEIAVKFYKDGNLELAENIYDIYIDRISKKLPKKKLMQELKDIALAFSYKDFSPHDISYAETVFQKLEDLCGIDSFDEELIYLRAFNLEKDKQYRNAKDIYSLLLKKYPQNKYLDEVTFKTGVIFAYALRDLKSAREHFNTLADRNPLTPHSFSALYQLGLLKQWEGDFSSAKVYYDKLIEGSQDKTSDIVQSTKKRLMEIEDGMPIEHNLNTFMDVSLKNAFANLDMSKIDLKSNIYMPKLKEAVDINASAYLSASGCFNVELQYLWSGDLGGAEPNIKEPGLKALYKNSGTKIVNLVLISPSGITDYVFDIIDTR